MDANDFAPSRKAERAAASADESARNAAHMKRVADAMAPDPKEWSFEGETAMGGEDVSCACGHKPIKNVFIIERKRDGRKLNIGCVCIDNTVPYLMERGAEGLARALAQAVERHREALAEAARQARDAAADKVVAALLEERAVLAAWGKARSAKIAAELEQERSDSRWGLRRSNTDVWTAGTPSSVSALQCKPRVATTPGRTAASLRTSLFNAYKDALLLDDVAWRGGPPPLPRDEKVRARLVKEAREVVATQEKQADSWRHPRGFRTGEPLKPSEHAEDYARECDRRAARWRLVLATLGEKDTGGAS